ncbi:hypothetical protein [Halomontanus rarus]|uniref:hypothetical protein n=1 Tax=Halomontanus rarus TaxID=3034020 RepID=UPI00307CBFE3
MLAVEWDPNEYEHVVTAIRSLEENEERSVGSYITFRRQIETGGFRLNAIENVLLSFYGEIMDEVDQVNNLGCDVGDEVTGVEALGDEYAVVRADHFFHPAHQ